MVLWSVAGLEAPLLARDLPTHGRSNGGEGGGEVVEGPIECGTRVVDGNGNKLHPSQYLLRASMRGEYFSVFLWNLTSQPRSLQKLISTMTRVHYFLSKEVGSGEGASRTPLA